MKTLLAALLSMPSLSLAAPQAKAAPRPGPEVQKLGYYVGTWEGHGETKAGPFGGPGKLSSRMKCGWFAGGFQVICRGHESGPSGTRQFLNILSYDEKAKAYAEYSVSNFGESEYDQGGSLTGDKLTFLVEQEAGGKPAKFRYAETHVTQRQMTYKAEVSVGREPWSTLAEGVIRKLK